eukprot:6741956-Pyramimonas_sp.AAC.1
MAHGPLPMAPVAQFARALPTQYRDFHGKRYPQLRYSQVHVVWLSVRLIAFLVSERLLFPTILRCWVFDLKRHCPA